jgi:hypothetical protein
LDLAGGALARESALSGPLVARVLRDRGSFVDSLFVNQGPSFK